MQMQSIGMIYPRCDTPDAVLYQPGQGLVEQGPDSSTHQTRSRVREEDES